MSELTPAYRSAMKDISRALRRKFQEEDDRERDERAQMRLSLAQFSKCLRGLITQEKATEK